MLRTNQILKLTSFVIFVLKCNILFNKITSFKAGSNYAAILLRSVTDGCQLVKFPLLASTCDWVQFLYLDVICLAHFYRCRDQPKHY